VQKFYLEFECTVTVIRGYICDKGLTKGFCRVLRVADERMAQRALARYGTGTIRAVNFPNDPDDDE
jgi:hypothetical protein